MLLPRIVLAALAIGFFAARAQSAAAPAAAAPSAADKQKLNELRLLALGEDRPAAYTAFMDLTAMADPARPTLVATLRQVLTRDHGLIEENLRKITAGGDIKTAEAAIATQQAAAIAKIDKLATVAEVNQARADYTKLAGTIKRVNDLYAPRALLLDILQTRTALLGLWKDVGAKMTPNPIDLAAEAKLSQNAEQALGPYAPLVKKLQASLTAWTNPEPASPEQAGLLTYRLRRRADGYNRSLAPLLDRSEAELLREINIYRDVLGLGPLEADARLVQAARRHSKEMVDQKYFSNVSPNAQTKDSLARRKNAGYEAEGFWSEALTRGPSGGVQTFWAMFDQPLYHKGMTDAKATAIGIGKWNTYWTIEIAGGPRLMLASQEDRDKAVVNGEVVPPQVPAAVAKSGSGSGGVASSGANGSGRSGNGDDGRITDPRQIKPRVPNGAGSVPSIPGIPGLGGF